MAKKKKRKGPSVSELRKAKRARKNAEIIRRKLREMARDIEVAKKWPLHECRVSDSFQEHLLSTVLISRARPDGAGYLVAFFLVDLGCLGVKSTHLQLFQNEEHYQEMINDHGAATGFPEVEPGFARRVIEVGHAYGTGLGFAQAPEYETLMAFLHNIEPDDTLEIQCGGQDGKPVLIPGPDDDPLELLELANAKLGEENFNYMGILPE